MSEWLHDAIWQGREYAGAGMLIAGFLTTFFTLWLFRRRDKIDRAAAFMLAPLAFVVICRGGTKPPPPGPPPGPQLSEYARIYARPEFGGSPTNTVHGLRPAGTLEVK